MNPDIKYEIVMVIAMTTCFVSGFLFAGWNGEKAVQSYAPAERCKFLVMPILKILFIPESREGFS